MIYATYGFYLGLLIVAGAGEYFHLLPAQTLFGVLSAVLGHGISMISQGRVNGPANKSL